MTYFEFYELNEEPFAITVNNKFFFNSQIHTEALIRLLYAVDTRKGLAVLVGDIGTGKTTLAQKMLDSMDDTSYESVLLIVIHNKVTSEWFLTKMAKQLGITAVSFDKTAQLTQIYNRLVELYEQGKKVAVLIDEAQMLTNKELMEEFRGLLNIEYEEHKLITFVFFGLPDIDECLKLDEPLKQRVAIRYELKSLSAKNTREYIEYRLNIAGAKRPIFTPEAMDAIHLAAGGIPRLINTIGDNALLEGFLIKKTVIDEQLIKDVVTDLRLGGEAKTF